MQIQGNKIILTTFESGNNHYYDSTFNIQPYIKPNSKGLYTVEINEVWGRNNEPTLENGDFIEFIIYYLDNNDGVDKECHYKCTYRNETFTYDSSSKVLITDMLNALYVFDTDTFLYEGEVEFFNLIDSIDLMYYKTNGKLTNISNGNIGIHWLIALNFRNGIDITTRKVVMKFSNNFCYLFNSLTIEKEATFETASDGITTIPTFHFYNMRLGGPYLYLIDTSPLQSEMKTINANSQSYNITALAYNNNVYHNGIIQGSSSMRTKTRDLSNLRIRLMNDQFDLVKIKEPLYIQLTVTNEED